MYKRRSLILFWLAGLITLVILACNTAEPTSTRTYYTLLNTSSQALLDISKGVLETQSERISPSDRLVVDIIKDNQLHNAYSSAATEDIFPRFIEELTPSEANDAALVLGIKRAIDFAHGLKEGETLNVSIVSPGTNDRVVLDRILSMLKNFKPHGATTFHIVGIDPAVRISFSSAFEPAKAMTKFSSSIEEFQQGQ